jgi:hypothetical protein
MPLLGDTQIPEHAPAIPAAINVARPLEAGSNR